MTKIFSPLSDRGESMAVFGLGTALWYRSCRGLDEMARGWVLVKVECYLMHLIRSPARPKLVVDPYRVISSFEPTPQGKRSEDGHGKLGILSVCRENPAQSLRWIGSRLV